MDGHTSTKKRGGPFSHTRLAPLTASEVDQHPDQPGLFFRQTDWHRSQVFGRPQERLLHQVVRLVSAGGEPSGEPVQPSFMRVKQGGEPLASVIARPVADRESEHRLSAHTFIDVPRPDYFECRSNG